MNLINLFLLPDHRIIGNDYCLAILIILICVVYLQLRSSFKQAFSKKKSNKPQSPHDEIEEMTDSSLPSSPKLQHTNRQTSTAQPLRSSPSTTEWVQTHIYTVHRHLCEIRYMHKHLHILFMFHKWPQHIQ